MNKKHDDKEEERRRAAWLRDLSFLERRVVSRSGILLSVLIVSVLLLSMVPAPAYIHSAPVSPIGPVFNPAAAVGYDASVNVGASYYSLTSAANTTYTFDVPVVANGSFTSIPAFASGNSWTESSSTEAGWTQDFNSPTYFGYFSATQGDSPNVELDQVVFDIGDVQNILTGNVCAAIDVVYANLTTPDGSVYSWSHTFNTTVGSGDINAYAYIDPQWLVNDHDEQWGSSWSVQFTETIQPIFKWYTAPAGMTSDTGSQTNSLSTSKTGSNCAISGVKGFSYSPKISSFNIPQYLASYDVYFSNPQIPQIYAEYCSSGIILDSGSPSTPGALAYTSLAAEVNGQVSGDPVPTSTPSLDECDLLQVTYNITLIDQKMATEVTDSSYYSASIPYAPSNPSPNEFTYNISFSYSTPSDAYYGAYESAENSYSLDYGSDSFSLSVSGLVQPYYSCPQSGFLWSLNNGSYASQSSASSHSVSATSTASSSGTVNDFISTISVANTPPKFVSSGLEYTGTGSAVRLYFNISQPKFSGEQEEVEIEWGDGTTTSTQGDTYSLEFTHSYAHAGAFSIQVSFWNIPSVTEGILSDMSGPSQVLTWNITVNVIVTPAYGTALTSGQTVTAKFTAVNDIVGNITAYDSGTEFFSKDIDSSSGTFTMSPPSAGVSDFVLVIDFDGAFYSVSYFYTIPLYPDLNSTYAVEVGSNSLTKQYPINVTNSGTSSSGSSTLGLSMSSSYWSPYANPNLTNLLFRYTNGSLIPSELSSHSSTSAEWILNISSVPAGQVIRILQIFYPLKEAVFNNLSLPAQSYSDFSVSIGSVENSTLVNSSNLSFVHYSQVSNYPTNPLQQSFTYTIPNYFDYRFVQINYNASWLFQYDAPSFVSQDFPYDSEVLFSNVTGVSEFTISFAQPSTLINTPTEISVQLQVRNQTVSASDLSEFIIQDRYTLYASTAINYLNESSEYFIVPFGSTDTFYILDPWNGVVGVSSPETINGYSVGFTVQLHLTLVTVQFVNTSATTIQLSQNGIAATFNSFLSFYTANDSSYQLFADIYDASLGRNVNYSGTFRSDAPSQILWVNVTAPLSQDTFSVDAYSGSGAGPLNSYPPDNVTLNINGGNYQIGVPLTFQVGESLSVRVEDPLGITLAQENLTVGSIAESFTVQVTTPSYLLSFRNDEQALPGSQLATEYINISQNAHSYQFTDMVGDTASLYLASGNYHLYLHDNATFAANISLTQDENYIIFGQQLVTTQEFNSRLQQIYNSTSHFSIVPRNAPTEIQTGTPASLLFNMYCSNGTPLSLGQMRSFVENSTVSLESGGLSVPLSVTETSQYLIINFTAPSSAGSYVLFIQGYLYSDGSTISAEYSTSIDFQASVQVGMQISLTIPSQVEKGVIANGSLAVSYGNGSRMDSHYTRSVLNNLTILVYRDGNLISVIHPYFIAPGLIGFGINMSVTGNGYSIFATVSKTLIYGSYAYSSVSSGFAVIGYNPASGPPNSLTELGTVFANNIDLIASIIGVLAAIYYIYRFLRRRSLTLKGEENTAGLTIESIVIEKVLAGIPLTPQEQVIYDKIPRDRLNRIINLATSGKIKEIKKRAKKVKKSENV